MKKPSLMGSHQRCWIWGRMSVVETLRAARWPILELHLNADLPPDELHAATRLAEGLNLAVSLDSAEALSRLCRSDEHQGYLAKMPPFPYDDAEELLQNRSDRAFYVLLDAVQDPFNFGAILRSADALGVDAVFVGAANQVDVTSLVVRASAGAVNHVPLAKVDDLAAWIGRLKEAGLSVVGTSPRAKRDASQHDFRKAFAIVLGNEAIGIRPEILALCDERVTIRQQGHVGSLNAAVSAGILCYEVCRQRNEKAARGGRPE
jgi:23S rRNA (guanosine2251-2'-O)-methyltransferase